MEHIHVKVEFGEAVSSKRDLLSCEMSLLNIAKNIDNYRKFRKQELSDKARIRAEAKKIISEIKTLKEILPKTHAQKPEKQEKPKEKIRLEPKPKKTRMESELNEIKERLERLAQ